MCIGTTNVMGTPDYSCPQPGDDALLGLPGHKGPPGSPQGPTHGEGSGSEGGNGFEKELAKMMKTIIDQTKQP